MTNMSQEAIVIEKGKEYIDCPHCGFTIVPQQWQTKKTVKDKDGKEYDDYKFGHFCPKCNVMLTIKKEL